MKNAISLFCSSGIGDLGLQANGVRTIIANELLPERARFLFCMISLVFSICTESFFTMSQLSPLSLNITL